MEKERIQLEKNSRTLQQRSAGSANIMDNRPDGSRNYLSGHPLQRVEDDEEDVLQGKLSAPAQRVESEEEDEDVLQGKMTDPVPKNETGLPDNLKAGVESLSGYSLDDVRVHYNSSKPATVQALAYTQGTDIHVAPGQEKHLPHEAWHVAQQMAGRVSPTTDINGMPVNDNVALEHEADVMGEKALIQRKKEQEELRDGTYTRRKIELRERERELRELEETHKKSRGSKGSKGGKGGKESMRGKGSMGSMRGKGSMGSEARETIPFYEEDGGEKDYRKCRRRFFALIGEEDKGHEPHGANMKPWEERWTTETIADDFLSASCHLNKTQKDERQRRALGVVVQMKKGDFEAGIGSSWHIHKDGKEPDTYHLKFCDSSLYRVVFKLSTATERNLLDTIIQEVRSRPEIKNPDGITDETVIEQGSASNRRCWESCINWIKKQQRR